MKRFFLLIFLCICVSKLAAQQQTVSIGTTQTDPDAVLLLVGNGSQGLVIPIITTLGSFGKQGMIAYNQADNKVYYNNGGAVSNGWVELGGGGASGTSYSLQMDPTSKNNIELLQNGVAVSSIPLSQKTSGPSANEFLMYDGTQWTSGNSDLTLSGTTLSLTGDVTPVTLGTLSMLNTIGSAEITNGAITGTDIADNTITNAKIANVDASKITTGTLPVARGGTGVTTATNGQVLIGNGTGFSLNTLTGGTGITVTNGAGSVQISSTGLSNPMTTNGDLIFRNGITNDRLGIGTAGQVLTVAAGVPSWQPLVVNSTTITDNSIVDVDVSTSAAIAGTKITPAFGTQNISTSGTMSSGAITSSGTITATTGVVTSDLNINGLDYTWPGALPSSTAFLSSTNTGILGWSPLPAAFSTANVVPKGDGTSGLIASQIFDNGTNVGIGTTSPHASLHIANGLTNRKIILEEAADNDHQFYGFGIATNTFRYQLPDYGNGAHVFFGGTSTSVSGEMMRIHNDYLSFGGRARTNRLSNSMFDLDADVGSGLIGMNINSNDSDAQPFYGYANQGNVRMRTYMNGTNGDWRIQTGAGTDLLSLSQVGALGIGTSTPVNRVDVEGNLAIGTTYSGTNTAPADGAIIQGDVGIGTINVDGKLHVAETVADLTGIDGAFINVQNTSTTSSAGLMAGIRFRTDGVSAGANARYKSGIFHQKTGTFGVGDMIFAVNNVASSASVTASDSKMIIKPTGEVGVGTSSPTEKLTVSGLTSTGVSILSDGNSPSFGGPASARIVLQAFTGLFVIPGMSREWTIATESANSHNLDILTRTASDVAPAGEYSFTSSAFIPYTDNTNSLGTGTRRWVNVFATNGTIQTSDLRLKTNVRNLDYGLSEVMKFRPVSYSWKDDTDSKKIGLIAQEVKSLVPEVVTDGEYLGMNYSELVPVLINAIQEQQKMIENLNRKLEDAAQASQQFDAMRSEIDEIKRLLGVEANAIEKK